MCLLQIVFRNSCSELTAPRNWKLASISQSSLAGVCKLNIFDRDICSHSLKAGNISKI